MTLLGRKDSLLRKAVERIRSLTEDSEITLDGATRGVAVIGHRGAPRELAENTVAGCRKAVEHGADGVEVDVCVTRDGKVVLWHDRDPDSSLLLARKLEDGAFFPQVPPALRRPVTELDWSDVSAHFGQRPHAEPASAAQQAVVPVDTLDRLMAWAAGEPRAHWLLLDVKLVPEEAGFVPRLLRRLSELISAHSQLRARKLRLLTPIREIYTALDAGLSADGSLKCCKLTADFELGGAAEVACEIGARHVAIGVTPARPWSLARRELKGAILARDAGALESVTVWTLNDGELVREASAWGSDAVLTDDVTGARRAIGET